LAVAKKELLAPDERALKAFLMVKKIQKVPPVLPLIVVWGLARTSGAVSAGRVLMPMRFQK